MSGNDATAESVRLIRDSAGAIAPRGGDFRRIRALRFSPLGFDRAVWSEICAMGWVGLLLPEDQGGAGLGMAEYCALAEALGAGLVPEPLIAAVLVAGFLPDPWRADQLAGKRLVLPAWQEAPGALLAPFSTSLADGALSGRKIFVPMANAADAFLVATNTGLALVPADGEGVSLVTAPTQDGGHFGTLTFEDSPAIALAGDFASALEAAALATSAYLLGVMDRVFALTLDYLRTREQFGRKIGSFQALQHRAADLKILLELTRASVASAAAVFDSHDDNAARACAVSRAKARATDAALRMTREAIQLHGGIAYTDEFDIGLFLRKAMVVAGQFGTSAWHRARYAALAPEDEE
jgi:alkylation response protein AidB-like acyl-CoA dehydrogenase